MNLPATFEMQLAAGADGRRGYAWQRSRDVEGLGVVMTSTRDSYGKAFVQAWSIDWLPNRTFGSLAALREAVAPLTDDAIAAERAKYPHVRLTRQIVASDFANRCRLCQSTGAILSQRNGALEVYIALSWRVEDVRYAELCSSHAHLAADPKALLAALDDAVAHCKPITRSKEFKL